MPRRRFAWKVDRTWFRLFVRLKPAAVMLQSFPVRLHPNIFQLLDLEGRGLDSARLRDIGEARSSSVNLATTMSLRRWPTGLATIFVGLDFDLPFGTALIIFPGARHGESETKQTTRNVLHCPKVH